MKHLIVLGIKFIVTAVLVFSTFGILFNANLFNLFWFTLLVTGISYLIGDLLILPRFGNIIATVADFGLAFFSLWILGSLFLEQGIPVTLLSLTAAFFIAWGEPFIHVYLENRFSDNNQQVPRNQLQTEFAEEMAPETTTAKRKKRKDK